MVRAVEYIYKERERERERERDVIIPYTIIARFLVSKTLRMGWV